MKSIYRIFIAAAVTFSLASCNFLDIVPDENATKEDTYSDKEKTEGYLYSCYSYLPQSNLGHSSLDFFYRRRSGYGIRTRNVCCLP